MTAQDKATGKKQDITITASTSLSKDEVDSMVEAAAANAAEDKKKRERAEVRNEADTLCFTAKRLLDDAKDKISDPEKKKIQEQVDALHAAIEKEDFDQGIVKDMTEALSKDLQEIGKKMYEAASKEVEKEEKEQPTKKDTGKKDATSKSSKGDDASKKDDDSPVTEGEVV